MGIDACRPVRRRSSSKELPVRVVLLIGTLAELDSCHDLYANTLTAAGHEVWIGSVNSLPGSGEDVLMTAGRADGGALLKAYAPFPGVPERRSCTGLDAVWVLNYPQASVQTEAWQLLWRLNRRVPFVNDVTGILMLGNKTNLDVVVPPGHVPDTLVSHSFDEVWSHYGRDRQATWLVKPTDEDAGADVYLLQPGSSNNRVLLQSMTGNTAVTELLTKGGLTGFRNRYCALQEYLPHTEEKRVILAAGRPVAQQLHRLAPDEHRGNTAHRAKCTDTTLTTDELILCERIGERLAAHGIRFAGIDLAYPYVFEANLVNPGGLDERLELGLPDRSPEILHTLLERTVRDFPEACR
jgi:glutathione synthase